MRILNLLRGGAHYLGHAYRSLNPFGQTGANGQYVTSAPSAQNAVDIFKGDWSSAFPAPLAGVRAGPIPLFQDRRVEWFASESGGVQGARVLELGPLEGGHSYMLEQRGAEHITAVEANTKGYLKCLITKELLGLRQTTFLCGDFLEYLRGADCPQFDVGMACGVLYHMVNPAELIGLLASHSRSHLWLWTHYYDERWAGRHPGRFPSAHQAEHGGFRHTLHRYEYGASVRRGRFCGGTRPYCHWMSRAEILGCLRHFGFGNVREAFDEPDHPGGPCFAAVASRG